MRCWLVCMQCGAKELLVERTKFDGGCLHCGGGPRTAENDKGEPMVIWSQEMDDLTSWDLTVMEEDTDEAKMWTAGKRILQLEAALRDIVHYWREFGDNEGAIETYIERGEAVLRAAGKRIRELEDALSWKPIDTAPKDGTEIIVYCPNISRRANDTVLHQVYITKWTKGWDTEGWEIQIRPWGALAGTLTHWMPLPEQPTPNKS